METKLADTSGAIPPAGTVDPFLGKLVEICVVTRDHRRTMEGLCRMGIGPWQIYNFSRENTTEQTYRGNPAEFVLKVCFADVGDLIWEIIEPVSGPNIFAEFLDAHGEGLHHLAYDCNNIPMEERIAEFERRGFKLAQSGKWLGRNPFCFFETEGATSTCFETYYFPPDWVYPEPDGRYPENT